MKIFIVEDSTYWTMRWQIQIMLSNIHGIETIGHAQYDESDVIECIDELSPDIAIINVSRQTESMVYFLKSIKERHALIKVMALSDYANPSFVDSCMSVGVDFFFDKVFLSKYSKNMRARAFMQIHAALRHLVNPSVLHDRHVALQ